MKTLVWLASFAVVLLFGVYVLKPQAEQGLLQAGWHLALPPVARGLPLTRRDAYLTGRVQKAFPVGTPQSRVIRDLGRQGFVIDERSADGEYKWISFSCMCHFWVHWYPHDLADKDSPIEKIDGEVQATVM